MPRVWKALAIVVAVVVAAAIITPNLVRSHVNLDGIFHPASALRLLNTAEITYASTYPKVGFSPSLAVLTGSSSGTPSEQQAGLIPTYMASGKFMGYRFTYSVTRDEKSGINVGYVIHADPDPDPENKPDPIAKPESRHF